MKPTEEVLREFKNLEVVPKNITIDTNGAGLKYLAELHHALPRLIMALEFLQRHQPLSMGMKDNLQKILNGENV